MAALYILIYGRVTCSLVRLDSHIVQLIVNHPLHYKDPVTGVHTNGIEGTWNGIKLAIVPRGRTA